MNAYILEASFEELGNVHYVWSQDSRTHYFYQLLHIQQAISLLFTVALSWIEIIAICISNLIVKFESSNCDNKLNRKCRTLLIYEDNFYKM